jgi:hypothetical protein
MKHGDGSLVFRLLVMVAGWSCQSEQLVVAYLREENHVLCEQLGNRAAPATVSRMSNLDA